MANKKFLEEYPLYKKYISDGINYWINRDLSKPAIHMFCKICDSGQTFNMTNEYYEVDGVHDQVIAGQVVRSRYLCTSCKKSIRLFFIEFGKVVVKEEDKDVEKRYMMKVGQNPPWDIEMDRELEKLLGGRVEYYKKGLICESQGYGIGAFSYFRRITEEIINELLGSVEELLIGEDKTNYHNALEEVKKTIVTQEKIELVKDLLPESLRPNGINPLSALHSALSEGLHAKSDEDCLEYADAVRNALVFLVNRLMRTKSENKNFTESMKKILHHKSQKIEKKNLS
jgi:hypothetical protein